MEEKIHLQRGNESSGQVTDRRLGPENVLTADYRDGILRIWFPAWLWSYGADALEKVGGTNPKRVVKAVAEWVFMLAFEWIKEYPVRDMCAVLETNHDVLAYTRKLLEAAGLCIVDKEKHWRNKFSMIRGAGRYEWSALLPEYVLRRRGNENLSYYDYCVSDTPFGGMFEKMSECEGMDEYVPERHGGWGALGEGVYESPYYDLTYRFSGRTFKARLFECYWVHAAASRFGVPPVHKHRLYNGFHYLPSVLRKNVRYRGDGITELFDLHCSFYTISVGLILEKYPDVDRDEVERFYWDCALGKLYEKCADYLSVSRDIAKEKLQGWRNIMSSGVAHYYKFGYNRVSAFMESTYPEIANIYYGWPTYVNGDGETKKALQRDLSDYETGLMSKLAFEIEEKYGVTCLLLHDAVYVSKSDKAKMPPDIEKKIFNWFESNILK